MPPRFPIRSALALTLALAASGCSRAETVPHAQAATPARAAPAVAAAHAPAAAPTRLVFFMNPNGRPCQLQDAVLQQLAGELRPVAEVVYVKTTEPGDIARFQEFGIRALPQLVVTDAAGRELRRATPGILGPDQVRALVAN